jgi:hypothetical protein
VLRDKVVGVFCAFFVRRTSPFRLALNLLIKYSIITNPETELEVNLPDQTITLKVTGEKNLLIFPDTKSKYDQWI